MPRKRGSAGRTATAGPNVGPKSPTAWQRVASGGGPFAGVGNYMQLLNKRDALMRQQAEGQDRRARTAGVQSSVSGAIRGAQRQMPRAVSGDAPMIIVVHPGMGTQGGLTNPQGGQPLPRQRPDSGPQKAGPYPYARAGADSRTRARAVSNSNKKR